MIVKAALARWRRAVQSSLPGGFVFVVLVVLMHRAAPTSFDLFLFVWSVGAAIVIAIVGAGVARAGLTGQSLAGGLVLAAGRWRQVAWVEIVVLAISLAILFLFAPVVGALGPGLAGEIVLFAALALIEFVELPAIYLAATGTAGTRSLSLALELLRAGVLGLPLVGLIGLRMALTVPLVLLRGGDGELLAVAGLAVVLMLALLWCGAAIETARGSQEQVPPGPD